MIRIIDDKTYHFTSVFNDKTGEYIRGINKTDDPFMAEYPHLIDIGTQGSCQHGRSGLCMKAGIKCYQDGLHADKPNMTLENFKKIIDWSKGRMFECLKEDEIILKKDAKTGIISSVFIRDIKVGDFVWNGTNSFVKVVAVNKKTVDSIFEIRLNYSRSIFATEEHMFPTNNGLKKVKDISLSDTLLLTNGKIEFDKISEIDIVKFLVEHDICSNYYISGPVVDKICADYRFKPAIPGHSLMLEKIKNVILDYDYTDCQLHTTGPNKINAKFSVTPELMYLLGHYVGNGSKRTYVISNTQTKMIENIENAINVVFPNFICNKKYVNNTVIFEFASKKPHNLLFDTVLECRNGKEKQLPNIIWNVPKEYKLIFLRGYFCDGNFSIAKNDGFYGSIVFNTSSKKLASDISLLLKSMDISYATRVFAGGDQIFSKKDPRIIHRKDRYRIYIGNFKELIKIQDVVSDHKNSVKFFEMINSEKKEKYLRDVQENKIEYIQKLIGKYNVVDINVDSEDHLFMTSHGIISHNCALGGAGDVDMHENFEEILKYSRENGIVPNFTTSGLGMTPEKAEICKKYCGAVAVSAYSRLSDLVPELAVRRVHNPENRKVYKSVDDIPVKFTLGNIDEDCIWDAPEYKINGLSYAWDELHHMYYSDEPQEYEFYRVFNEKQEPNYTMRAIKMLLDAGVKTNIHYVLSNTTIDEALIRMKYNGFPKGINAVVFLLHKPVGLGTEEDVLKVDDPRVAEFFELVDKGNFPFKIGFDSCSIPGVLKWSKHIDPCSIDTCEGSRFSMYITPDMKALPCSFDNQDQRFAYQLDDKHTIEDAWNSPQFNKFRDSLRYSCKGCANRALCMGGCPLQNSIVLCDNKERIFKNN